jgi:hypothetical protein
LQTCLAALSQHLNDHSMVELKKECATIYMVLQAKTASPSKVLAAIKEFAEVTADDSDMLLLPSVKSLEQGKAILAMATEEATRRMKGAAHLDLAEALSESLLELLACDIKMLITDVYVDKFLAIVGSMKDLSMDDRQSVMCLWWNLVVLHLALFCLWLCYVSDFVLFCLLLCSVSGFVLSLALFCPWLCSVSGFVPFLALFCLWLCSASGFVLSLALFCLWLCFCIWIRSVSGSVSGFVLSVVSFCLWFESVSGIVLSLALVYLWLSSVSGFVVSLVLFCP